MMRFLSIILVIAGLLAAGLGAAALLERSNVRTLSAKPDTSGALPSAPPADDDGPTDLRPAPATEATSIEPEPGAVGIESVTSGDATPPGAETGAGAGAPAASAPGEAAEAAVSDEAPVTEEAAVPEEEMGFMFQTQSDESPVLADARPPAAAQRAPVETSAYASTAAQPSFEETLKTVPVAHETPRSAEYKRAFDVTFAIDATGDATATDAMPGRGSIESSEARVSNQVEVRLSGASFEIIASSPPVQTLSPVEENVWRWSVKPLSAGTHDLVFEVYAIGSSSVTPLRTFQDTVTVKVSGLNRAIAFADQANPLFVLLGGLGSALAGLLGAIRFFGKK